jgi:hypothetical protein
VRVRGGRCVWLTNLPPSESRLSTQNVGASTSHNFMRLHGLYRDSFTFYSYLYFIRESPRLVSIAARETSVRNVSESMLRLMITEDSELLLPSSVLEVVFIFNLDD